MQKGRKAYKQPFKDVRGTRGSRSFKKKKKKKLASLGKILGNFLEKYIWMGSSVQASLQLYQYTNCYTCIFQECFLYFQNTFFQLSVVPSESIQNKRAFLEKRWKEFNFSKILGLRYLKSYIKMNCFTVLHIFFKHFK